ncbi:uncharacterized protein SPSC_01035 [Sporisorium scitamineum]|uniref:Uncharacterized protein n=1 Tax=Sporisorium scitamineum TaxID=49012 RepID=A0A0F7RX53_9BASI|nr:hypothetical protein [Sporisorium scitamineum]CDU22405.1 uncharacterized protein SPSC_01035 [Sporisorium scitamineum]
MTFFILLITNINIRTPLDETLVKEWFTSYYIQPSPPSSSASSAMAFYLTPEKSAVLDVLLKARFLMARVRLLNDDEYWRWLERLGGQSEDEGGRVREEELEEEGTAVSVRVWLAMMRREEDEEEEDTDLYTAAEQSLLNLDEDVNEMAIDEDTESDTDSDSSNANSEDQAIRQLVHRPKVDEAFLERVVLGLLEKWDLPASSSYSAFI